MDDPAHYLILGLAMVASLFVVKFVFKAWRDWKDDEKWFRECERVQRAWEDRER